MAKLKLYWVKLAISLLFLQCLSHLLLAQQQGAVLLLQRTALYTDQKLTKARLYTNRRQAHPVLDWAYNKKIKFKIQYKPIVKRYKSKGYILKNKTALHNLGAELIRVYPKLPENSKDQANYLWIPANSLKLNAEHLANKKYTYTQWYAAEYNLQLPQNFWIAPTAWVFRPQKTANWLNDLFKTLQKEKYSKDVELKILLGLVEAGYTKKQVELALGTPEQKNFDEQNQQWQWVYAGQRVLLKDDLVIQTILY